MNAKLIAALFATLIAASAHAEQQFGRDSVYANKSIPTSTYSSGAQTSRFGRDSVYVTNSTSPGTPVKVVSDAAYKMGRS